MPTLSFRPLVRFAVFAAFLVAVFPASPAFAANAKIEKDAKALDKKAMDTDYLGTDFASAETHLTTAITKCGLDKCSPALRAQLRRDLGVVLIGGKVDRTRGLQAFSDALAIDPGMQLDPDVRTKEIDSAWAQAKGGAAEAPVVKPAVPASGGDFTHTPPTEGQANTPLPLYVETTASSDKVVKVVVKYKSFGMSEFHSLVLKPLTPGFGASIPCADVTEGALDYFFQGFDANNDPIASAGDPNHPFRVGVNKTFSAATTPPHLPGQAAPVQCVSAADCPPDFPGCKSTTSDADKKDDGLSCESNDECKSGTCEQNKCGGAEDDKFSRVWIGIEGTFDITSLSSANDVCAIDTNDKSVDPNSGLPLNDKGYSCIQNGTDYPSRTDANAAKALQLGVADRVAGGFAPGNIRIMISGDYAITNHLMLGGRLGYVANRYPGSAANEFPPIHLEARGTFVIGPKGLARSGPSGYVYIAGGVAPTDAKVSVNVVETGFGSKTVDAWRVSGPGFGAIGFGLREQFSKHVALSLGPRFALSGGGGGVVPIIEPVDLSLQFGF